MLKRQCQYKCGVLLLYCGVMTDTKLGQIMEECDRLGANERAKLLKHLLGDSSINVTIGSSHFNADTVYQINLAALVN